MLQALVSFSIRFRGVVVALACLVLGYGVYITLHSKYDVYPEFAPPRVVIQTEAPGLAPEEVEQLVSVPVENSVNGVPGLETLRSQSSLGLSVVTITFQDRIDVYRARQMVSERISEAAARLPIGVQPPVMAPLTGSTSLLLIEGLTSKYRSPMELRTFADWVLRPRLLGIHGVARVAIFGGDIRQLQIQVAPEKLVQYGVSIEDVLSSAKNATGVRGAGFVEDDNQRITLRSLGQALAPVQIGSSIIRGEGGAAVRLRDVAHVDEAGAPPIGGATVNGEPGVLVEVSSQYRENTLEVTEAVEKEVAAMSPAFAAAQIDLHPAMFRPADFITTAVHNLSTSLLLGGVLVAVVLFLFLFNMRIAFISLSAIPLSLLIAIVILYYMGQSLNTLTLGGLAIAIGEVVDDAIIDVENIHRRLLQNSGRTRDFRSVFRVVRSASLEVRSAVVYATFVVAVVFIPVFALSGVQGRLFRPLAVTYVIAILSSLLVAVTVTPALCVFLLPKTAETEEEPRSIIWLKGQYARLLSFTIERRGFFIAGAAVLLAAALVTVPFLGGGFLPDLHEGHFIAHAISLPGTSLADTIRTGRAISRELLKDPGVASVAQQIGRAELADDTSGVNYSEFHIKLKPAAGSEVEEQIRRCLSLFPGFSFSIKPFLSERMEEVLSGSAGQVVIKILGNDLAILDQKAREVSAVLSTVPGAVDVQIPSPPGVPEIGIRLRPERLAQFGFQPVKVLDGIQTAYQGTSVSEVYEGNRIIDVVVILHPDVRRDPGKIGSLLLGSDQGVRVALNELADVFLTTGRSTVLHDGASRLQTVTCNVRGRDLASFVAAAQKAIAQRIAFPLATYALFTGTAEARAATQREVLLYSVIAFAGIVLLLYVVFGNLRNLGLILVNLPFALVGGIFAAYLNGGYITVGSLVGLITLFGITTRNSIMMISHFEHLVNKEGMTWGRDAAFRGAAERLVPILMTATVTALGLLPLAIGSGAPGREIEGPMAVVILGGLVTSTFLNLLLLPSLALRYGRFTATSD
ncbi:MAG TPA: efflux RND transporter permease subunit [Bryobacteraceae bacterium]|jgi:CzcA family heavy metal efflux pump|nr:efflux RND transporter permease subunit [Bryobacteraceae bacterium]